MGFSSLAIPNKEILGPRFSSRWINNWFESHTRHLKHNVDVSLTHARCFRREYVFTCVDSSETVSADTYGERHLAAPVRNADGVTATVIDINIGETRVSDRDS